MKRNWTEEELVERWTLFPDELALVGAKAEHTRLGFAMMPRFFAGEGRFPRDKGEVPAEVLRFVGEQVGSAEAAGSEGWLRYDWSGRTIKYHRAQIRDFFGFREATASDGEEVASWLFEEVLPAEQDAGKLREAFHKRCRALKIEPPTPRRVERLVASASRRFEESFCASVSGRLPEDALAKMDALLATGDRDANGAESDDPAPGDTRRSVLAWIKADPGRASLEAVLDEVNKLGRVREVGLPPDLFAGDSPSLVKEYRRRTATEVASELRAHSEEIRATLMAALLWWREREITDGLLDLLVRVVHKIGARAESRVEKELLEDLKRVIGKTNLLFRMAEAGMENPEGTVREVLYPVVGEQTLKELVKEYKGSGPAFRLNVHARLSSSYRGHYRRVLAPVLETLEFRSNNAAHRPVIEALSLLRQYAGSTAKSYPAEEKVPVEGVVPSGWRFLVVSEDDRGRERVDRVSYEVCALKALREALRSREVWVVGADHALKAEVGRHWSTTGLLEVFKEADLRVRFTDLFATSASREALDRDTLRRRLLLCLYGLGTNAGLKRMAGSNAGPRSGS